MEFKIISYKEIISDWFIYLLKTFMSFLIPFIKTILILIILRQYKIMWDQFWNFWLINFLLKVTKTQTRAFCLKKYFYKNFIQSKICKWIQTNYLKKKMLKKINSSVWKFAHWKLYFVSDAINLILY